MSMPTRLPIATVARRAGTAPPIIGFLPTYCRGGFADCPFCRDPGWLFDGLVACVFGRVDGCVLGFADCVLDGFDGCVLGFAACVLGRVEGCVLAAYLGASRAAY